MMHRQRTSLLLTAGLVSLGLVWACAPPEEPPPFVLMSEEEAEDARVPDSEWVVTERYRSVGPEIRFIEPEVDETDKGPTIIVVSPVDLLVQFEAAGAPVDISTLKVRVKRGLLPKVSLTSRIRPFVTETTLDAKDLNIPRGKYLLELSIADVNGSMSRETFRIHVTRG